MQKFKGVFMRFVRDEEGATAAEYGLIAGILAGLIIVAVRVFGTSLQGMFGSLSDKMNQASK